MNLGFFEEYFRNIDNLKLIRNKDQIPVYHSLDEYIKNFTIFEELKLNNLYYLFLIKLIITINIFIIFIIHYYIKHSMKNKIFRKLNTKYFVIKRNFEKINHSINLVRFKLAAFLRRFSPGS